MSTGNDSIGHDRREMPCGGLLVVDRLRSSGALTPRERQFCLSAGIPLAYDPLQSGWITQAAQDDICDSAAQLEPNQITPPEEPGKARVKLSFRPWQASDAGTLRHLLDNPEVWRFLYEPYPGQMTEETARDLIDLANAANHHRVRAIVPAGGDALPVGQIRLEFGETPAEPELSYWIGENHWGRGYGSEAVRRFSRLSLLEDPTMRAITAKVHHDNASSGRVLAKAGFQALGPDPQMPDWQRFILWRDA